MKFREFSFIKDLSFHWKHSHLRIISLFVLKKCLIIYAFCLQICLYSLHYYPIKLSILFISFTFYWIYFNHSFSMIFFLTLNLESFYMKKYIHFIVYKSLNSFIIQDMIIWDIFQLILLDLIRFWRSNFPEWEKVKN
jgi:hypothetical protein